MQEGSPSMPATTSLPPRCPGYSSLVYERHPDLGDYVYSPSINLWINWRITSDDHEFRLSGRGTRPSDGQVRLWDSIEGRLQELATKGISAIEAPRRTPLTDRFTREHLSLREVRMESEGVVAFFFGSPLCDELHMWPMVTFQELDLKGWRWVV